MTGEKDLEKLLVSMQPTLLAGDFVFCSNASLNYDDLAELRPIASYQEAEGLSLVLSKDIADTAGLAYESVLRCITLQVHSSLEAVGLTAAVSTILAANGISANVIAAYYHDHVYVPKEHADTALQLLEKL